MSDQAAYSISWHAWYFELRNHMIYVACQFMWLARGIFDRLCHLIWQSGRGTASSWDPPWWGNATMPLTFQSAIMVWSQTLALSPDQVTALVMLRKAFFGNMGVLMRRRQKLTAQMEVSPAMPFTFDQLTATRWTTRCIELRWRATAKNPPEHPPNDRTFVCL
jgi:hypothetical protein